jgi:hypothetical protein
MKRVILCALLILVCAGCASYPASVISATSPLPPGIRGTIPTHGSNCQYSILFGIIPVTSSPNTQEALNEAKLRAGCDVLTDVTVDRNSGWYVLFANSCVRVRGMGVPRDIIQEYQERTAGTNEPVTTGSGFLE